MSEKHSFEEVPERDRFYFLYDVDRPKAEDDRFAWRELRLGLGASHSEEFKDAWVEPGRLEVGVAQVSPTEIYPNMPMFFTTRSAAEKYRQKKGAGGIGPTGEALLVDQFGWEQANQLIAQMGGQTLRVWWVDRAALVEALEGATEALTDARMLLDGETLAREELLKRLRK